MASSGGGGSSGGGSSGGGGGGGGSSGGGGGGGGGGGSSESSTTTLPPSGGQKTTTSTVPNATGGATSTTIASDVSGIRLPAGAGKAVAVGTQPASTLADGVAIAVKRATLTFAIDPPDLPKSQKIDRYQVRLTLVGSTKSVTRTLKVVSTAVPLLQSFTKLNGSYQITVSAINSKGRVAGVWKSGSIKVTK